MMHVNEIINFALYRQILTCTQNLHHNQFQEAEDTSTKMLGIVGMTKLT